MKMKYLVKQTNNVEFETKRKPTKYTLISDEIAMKSNITLTENKNNEKM